ncbi:hypothetical protein [Nocardia asteroides]|uniref:hypothetical protein n=1 Tax=Nocardia asteroides TaxID=1824 RepID=UPI00340A8EDB
MYPNQPSTDPIIQRGRELSRAVFNNAAAAENPDLVYPDWPSNEPLPNLHHWVVEAETAYYAHLREHREHLTGVEEFRTGYEFLDHLESERADLRDYQTWTGDPEEPLRRADRRRSR